MSSEKVLLGVLAGITVGATLGILFAPDKGSATRDKISQKSHDYVDELGGKFNDVVKTLTEKIETLSEETRLLAHNGKTSDEKNAVKSTDGVQR